MRSPVHAVVRLAAFLLVGFIACPFAAAFPAPLQTFLFDDRESEIGDSVKRVKPDDQYDAKRGYGFEPDSTPTAVRFSISGGGSISVEIVLQADQPGVTTVKAEARRLMLERVETKAGERVSKSFQVDIRTPQIPGGGVVKLTEREKQGVNWDEKLTIEIFSDRPILRRISIRASENPPTTIYLAGDSTVCDQPHAPFSSWGAMLPRFFDESVCVVNHAESGRALKSFRNEKRLDKILSVLRPGDYVFIQFGHNDQKEKGAGVGALTTYKADLEAYVDAIQERHAKPVLVTPMYRRRFDDAGKLQDTLGDYPAAVRQVARERKLPLIDLHEMSGKLITALGPEASKKAFVHYPAKSFPGQDQPLKDDSHFSDYGAYELAKCVVEGIRKCDPELAKRLREDVKPFDPAKPDAFETVRIPGATPKLVEKPEGS